MKDIWVLLVCNLHLKKQKLINLFYYNFFILKAQNRVNCQQRIVAYILSNNVNISTIQIFTDFQNESSEYWNDTLKTILSGFVHTKFKKSIFYFESIKKSKFNLNFFFN